MSDFEKMARELREEHQNKCASESLSIKYGMQTIDEAEAKLNKEFDDRCVALLRRVADLENEICAQIAATETGDIADAIAARRKNRSAT